MKFRVGFKSKPDTTTLLKQSRDCTYKTNKTETLVYSSNTLKKHTSHAIISYDWPSHGEGILPIFLVPKPHGKVRIYVLHLPKSYW